MKYFEVCQTRFSFGTWQLEEAALSRVEISVQTSLDGERDRNCISATLGSEFGSHKSRCQSSGARSQVRRVMDKQPGPGGLTRAEFRDQLESGSRQCDWVWQKERAQNGRERRIARLSVGEVRALLRSSKQDMV